MPIKWNPLLVSDAAGMIEGYLKEAAEPLEQARTVAREALRCQDHEVVGHSIKELKLPDYTILDCLGGNEFNDLKKDLITATGRYQYFATGRPIRDSAGHIIGAVEIANDIA